jgi:hypothetical protein
MINSESSTAARVQDVPLPGAPELRRWLRDMMQIREFEVRCMQAYQNRLAGGFLHVYNGQEGVAVGCIIEVIDPTPVEDSEGCLSLPGIDVLVRRPAGIRVAAMDLNGDQFVMEWDDHFARVCQHETDHLDGVLIIDRMSTMERLRNRKAIRALERA